ncbi:MAG: hypothetical protein HQM04_09800 [Magnetococcales bacterium]|nr:hypothetical protein [Magnetococcales bacterium]MBF0115326.1 hypothetical protein [Magnetococcales bacterium]
MKVRHSLGFRLLLTAWSTALALMIGLALVANEAAQIHHEAMEDHFFMNFLNIMLETRRYEKSFFRFQRKHDWDNVMHYLDQVDRQLRFERKAFLARINGQNLHNNLTAYLAEYRERLLQAQRQLDQDPKQLHELELALHQIGRQFLTIAEQLASDTKNDITVALQRTQWRLFFCGLLLLVSFLLLTLHFLRRIHAPFRQLRSALQQGETIGLYAPIQLADPDPLWQSLLNPVNHLLGLAQQSKADSSQSRQQTITSTLLIPISKTLAQPLANLSTTCQILMEEGSADSSPERLHLVQQLRQLAEQGNRIITAIQQYALISAQALQPIATAPLLRKAVNQALQLPLSPEEWRLELSTEGEILGNAPLLEQILTALLQHTWDRSPPDALLLLTLSQYPLVLGQEETGEHHLAAQSWLPSTCREVVEINMPLAGDLSGHETLPGQECLPYPDIALLFLPQNEDNPALCLVPDAIRLHQGALRVEAWQPSWLRLRLLFPAVGTPALLRSPIPPTGLL